MWGWKIFLSCTSCEKCLATFKRFNIVRKRGCREMKKRQKGVKIVSRSLQSRKMIFSSNFSYAKTAPREVRRKNFPHLKRVTLANDTSAVWGVKKCAAQQNLVRWCSSQVINSKLFPLYFSSMITRTFHLKFKLSCTHSQNDERNILRSCLVNFGKGVFSHYFDRHSHWKTFEWEVTKKTWSTFHKLRSTKKE